jgi:hypothetical protein
VETGKMRRALDLQEAIAKLHYYCTTSPHVKGGPNLERYKDNTSGLERPETKVLGIREKLEGKLVWGAVGARQL